MLSSWWLLWTMFLLVFILPPVGYGWGYRGWGPPYPRYLQRRRGARASTMGATPTFDHHAWGRGGDLLWFMIIVWGVWAASSLWWR